MRRFVDKKQRGSVTSHSSASSGTAISNYPNSNSGNNNGGGNANGGYAQNAQQPQQQPARVASIGSVGNKMTPVGNGRPVQSLPPPASVAAAATSTPTTTMMTATSGGPSSSSNRGGGGGGQRLSNSNPVGGSNSNSNKKRQSGGSENLVHLNAMSPTTAFSPVLPTGGYRPVRQMNGPHVGHGNSYGNDKGKRRNSVYGKSTGTKSAASSSGGTMGKQTESGENNSKDPSERTQPQQTNTASTYSNTYQRSPARVSPLQTLDPAHVHLKGKDIAFLALDLNLAAARPTHSTGAPGTARSAVSGFDSESPRSADGVSPRAGDHATTTSTKGTVRPAQRHGKLQSHNKLASNRLGSRPSSAASRKSSFRRGTDEPFVLPPPAAMQPPLSSSAWQQEDVNSAQQRQAMGSPSLDSRREDPLASPAWQGGDDLLSTGSPSLGPQGEQDTSPKPATRKQGNVQAMESTETSLPKSNSRFNLVRRFSFGRKKRPQSATSQTKPPPVHAMEPPRSNNAATAAEGQEPQAFLADGAQGNKPVQSQGATIRDELTTNLAAKDTVEEPVTSGKREGTKTGSRFTKKVGRRSTYGNIPEAGLRSVVSGIPYSPFFQPMDTYPDMQTQESYYHYSGLMNSFMSGNQSGDDNYYGFGHSSSFLDDGRDAAGNAGRPQQQQQQMTTKGTNDADRSPNKDDFNGSRSPSPVPFVRDAGPYPPFSSAQPGTTTAAAESTKNGDVAPPIASMDDFTHLSYRDMLAYIDDSIEGFEDLSEGMSGFGTTQKSSPIANGATKTYAKAGTTATASVKTQPSGSSNVDGSKAQGEAQSRNYRRSRSIHEGSEGAAKPPHPIPTFSVRPNAQPSRLVEAQETTKPSGGNSFLPRTEKATQVASAAAAKAKESDGAKPSAAATTTTTTTINSSSPGAGTTTQEPPAKAAIPTMRNPIASLASSLPFHTLQFPMKQSSKESFPYDNDDGKSGMSQPSMQSAEPQARNRLVANTAPRKTVQATTGATTTTTVSSTDLNTTYETLVLEEVVTDSAPPPPSSIHTHAPPPSAYGNEKSSKRYTSPKRKAGGVALTSKYLSVEADLSSGDLDKPLDAKGRSTEWKDSFQDLQFDYGKFVDASGGQATIAAPRTHQNSASGKTRGASSDGMTSQRHVSGMTKIDPAGKKDARNSAEKKPGEVKPPTVMQTMSVLASQLAKEIHSQHNSQPRDKDSRDVDKLVNSLRDSLSLDKLSSSHSHSRDDFDRHGTPKPANALSRSDVTRRLSSPTQRSPTNPATTETPSKGANETKLERVATNSPTPLKSRAAEANAPAITTTTTIAVAAAPAASTAPSVGAVASTPNAQQSRRSSARHLPPIPDRDSPSVHNAGPIAVVTPTTTIAHHQPTLQSSHLQEMNPIASGSVTSPNDVYKNDGWRNSVAHVPSYPKPYSRVKSKSVDEGSMRLAPMSKPAATANSCSATPAASPMFSSDETSPLHNGPPSQNVRGVPRRANLLSSREAFTYDDLAASSIASPQPPTTAAGTTENLDDRTAAAHTVEKSSSVPSSGPGLKELFGAGTARALRTRSKTGTSDGNNNNNSNINNGSFNADGSTTASDNARTERKQSGGDAAFPALPSQNSAHGDGFRSKDFAVSPKRTRHQMSPSLSARAKMFEDAGDTDSFFTTATGKPTPKSLQTQSAPSITSPSALPPISNATGSRRTTATVPVKLGITPAENVPVVERATRGKARLASRAVDSGTFAGQRSLKQPSDDTLTDDGNHLSFRNTEFSPLRGDEDRYAEESSGDGSGYAGRSNEVIRVEVNSKGLGVSVVDNFGSGRNNNYSVVHSTLSTRYANRSSLSQSLQRSPQTVNFGDTDAPNIDLTSPSPSSLGEGQLALKMLMNVETAQMRHARNNKRSPGTQRDFCATTALNGEPFPSSSVGVGGDTHEISRYNNELSEEQQSELQRVLDELKPASGRVSVGDAAGANGDRREEGEEEGSLTAPISSSASTRAPSVDMAGAQYRRRNGMKEKDASQIAEDVQHLANYYLTSTTPQEKNMANPRSGHLRSSQQCYQESSQLI